MDLNEATREVIALSLSELQRHRVDAQSELADDLPPMTADRVQLGRVRLDLSAMLLTRWSASTIVRGNYSSGPNVTAAIVCA